MDTPVPQHDPGLETRVFRLEADVSGVRESLARIEAVLPHLATAAQIAEMRAELAGTREDLGGQISDLRADLGGQVSDLRADLGGQISELRGRMNHLPTAWQMMTGIVAGQCTLAALLAAIVFGVLKIVGHG
jgi:phage-related minor tail protein